MSTTVRTRDTVFPLFGDAGTREFGESVRARSASLALRRPVVGPEEVEENLAAGEEMQVERGREQPDPEELRRRAEQTSADARGLPARSHGAESR